MEVPDHLFSIQPISLESRNLPKRQTKEVPEVFE